MPVLVQVNVTSIRLDGQILLYIIGTGHYTAQRNKRKFNDPILTPNNKIKTIMIIIKIYYGSRSLFMLV